MPALSPTMTTGTLIQWHKAVGKSTTVFFPSHFGSPCRKLLRARDARGACGADARSWGKHRKFEPWTVEREPPFALLSIVGVGNTTADWPHAGDTVSSGDLLFDIETDKANMAVESTEDGILAKILVDDGASVGRSSVHDVHSKARTHHPNLMLRTCRS